MLRIPMHQCVASSGGDPRFLHAISFSHPTNTRKLEKIPRSLMKVKVTRLVFSPSAEISKFMALEVPEDYNYSLGLQEGVMDLFDFI